jgi:predicted nucleic acid-binding protein
VIFIDANIFLAYANASDVHHERAAKIVQDLEKKETPCFTSDYVFNEIVGVTLRKQGKTAALTIGNHLLKSLLVLNIDDHAFKEAWRLFATTKHGLSLVDCTNVIAAKLAGATGIATFDKEFRNVPGLSVIA